MPCDVCSFPYSLPPRFPPFRLRCAPWSRPGSPSARATSRGRRRTCGTTPRRGAATPAGRRCRCPSRCRTCRCSSAGGPWCRGGCAGLGAVLRTGSVSRGSWRGSPGRSVPRAVLACQRLFRVQLLQYAQYEQAENRKRHPQRPRLIALPHAAPRLPHNDHTAGACPPQLRGHGWRPVHARRGAGRPGQG